MRISASLVSAPLERLGQAVQELESAGVDYLHFDIEDGSFVPCMNLGTKVIARLRGLTNLPFDVHLMMVNPEWLLPELAAMGVNRISVHYEACPYPRRVLRQIASLGIAAGLAFNPVTPIPDLNFLDPYLAFLVVLTTEPEIPDSPFLPRTLEKVSSTRQVVPPGVEWVVDGGVRADNLAQVMKTGANTVVVGRALFHGHTIAQNVHLLRAAMAG